MYTPAHFSHDDPALTLGFMQRYNFAALVSVADGLPVASHLPFAVEESGGKITLLGHMARNNPQWQNLSEQTSLVIFSEPHAYISPGLYEKEQNVPTWNYIAVHAYGCARLISEESEAFALLEKQMTVFEADYLKQWKKLSADYKNALLKGIVAFEIPVEKLESRWKLSQNKSAADRHSVQEYLANSAGPMEQELAHYMARM